MFNQLYVVLIGRSDGPGLDLLLIHKVAEVIDQFHEATEFLPVPHVTLFGCQL